MATTIVPGSSWQTVFVATLYKFSKPASDKIIMQLNAADIRESHASYDISGNKFKVECLIVDAARAFSVLNQIIKKFVLQDEEKSLHDPNHHPQATRIFESHLEDSNEDEEPIKSLRNDILDISDDYDTESSQVPTLASDRFMPKDPRLEQFILFSAPKENLEAHSGCQIIKDPNGHGLIVKGATPRIVEKVIEQLRLLGRDENRLPGVEHISMARGNVELKLVRLANLRNEPTLGTILLPPNSPHFGILLKSNILQIHAYNEDAQKHKGLPRKTQQLPSGQDVDIFSKIKFSTNYRLSNEVEANDPLSADPSKALNSNVGEWLGGLRAAAEETEAQKDRAPGKILALFNDSEALLDKIPPPSIPSTIPDPPAPAPAPAPSPWKKVGRESKSASQQTSKNTSATTSASGASVPKRITKFSETPGPRQAWEVVTSKGTGEVVHGRWGEAAQDRSSLHLQQDPPSQWNTQSLNVFPRGFVPRAPSSNSFAQTKLDLIDLSDDNDPDDGILQVPPPGFSEPLQPTIETQNLKPIEQTVTDQLEEEEDTVFRPLRRTMRQKAAKKVRGGRKGGHTDPKTAAAHAMLKQEASEVLASRSSSSSQTSPSEGPTRVSSPATTQRPAEKNEAPVDVKSLRPIPAKFVYAIQNGLKSAHMYAGTLSLEVQLGIVIMLEKNIPDDLVAKLPVSSSNIIPRLSNARGFGTIQESFTAAVTAKVNDITDLLMESGIDATQPFTTPSATYEIICQRADEEYVRLHIDAADPARKSFMLTSQPDLMACIYMHFPHVIHDARAVILGEQKLPISKSPELRKFVDQLRISMSAHDPTLPTVYGKDYGNLRVKSMFIRSTVAYKLPGKPCLLRIVRIHDLEVSRPQLDEDNPGNFNAGPSDKETMISARRVWYELSLELADPPKELSGTESGGFGKSMTLDSERIMDEHFINSLVELQNASQEMVHRMKGLGIHNKGPAYSTWLKIINERMKRGEVESYW